MVMYDASMDALILDDLLQPNSSVATINPNIQNTRDPAAHQRTQKRAIVFVCVCVCVCVCLPIGAGPAAFLHRNASLLPSHTALAWCRCS
jgi:hypothetical protein